MSYFVYCSTDTRPCPDQSQAVMAEPSAEDYAALGITGESLAAAVGAGAGIIFALALLGFAVGSAIKLIEKL